jgi:predicted dehydrogenase
MALRAAVIGLGIGRLHAESLAAMGGVDLVAVADLDAALAERVGAACGAAVHADGAELLSAEEVDLVSICTSPATHLAFTRQAAAAGVHVICEKPMAPTLEDCDGMIWACRDAGVKLMIAQKKRFEPAYRFIKEQAAGDFGPVRWASATYALGRASKPWFWAEEDGGGPLHENAVHMMDILRFLMGDVERVYAEGGNLFNPDYPAQVDAAAITLRFANGAVAAVGAGQASEWGFATEHVCFSHDNAVAEVGGPFDSPRHLRYVLKGGGQETVERTFADFDPFRAELEHFADCVRADGEPGVPGEEGRASVALCLAVKQSVRTGRLVAL